MGRSSPYQWENPRPIWTDLWGEDQVASGLYRFVRNPMYVCVLVIVAGQALLLGQAWLFAYAGVVLAAFHVFVRVYEEPQLRQRFGGSYKTYCLHVGRWWPRLTPWRAAGTGGPTWLLKVFFIQFRPFKTTNEYTQVM